MKHILKRIKTLLKRTGFNYLYAGEVKSDSFESKEVGRNKIRYNLNDKNAYTTVDKKLKILNRAEEKKYKVELEAMAKRILLTEKINK